MISNQNKSYNTASTTFTTSNGQNDDNDFKYENTRKVNRNHSNERNRMDSSGSDNYADMTAMRSGSPQGNISSISNSNSEFPNDDFANEVEMNKADSTCSSTDVDDDDEGDCGIAQLYLNEMEINRNEEEESITELVCDSGSEGDVVEANQITRSRVPIGIILRLVLPLANGVVRGIKGIRDVRFLRVLKTVASSRQAFTNLVAFAANTISMNLSSVQVSHRIEPILKLMKIRKSRDGLESLPDIPGIASSAPTTSIMSPTISLVREPSSGSLPHFSTSKRKASIPEHPAPKCCTLNILAEPPAGCPIRADIVFIHGLHGSLVNTWKQGVWENERRPVEFQRPPKPPVRPPKRPRHSRSTLLHPPHEQKRARFATLSETYKQSTETDAPDDISEVSYVCGQPEDNNIFDGIEYSFPTFRVRMNDNGRLLQAELESILNDENTHKGTDQQIKGGEKRTNPKTNTKPSPDDPNYSKCWPGDWLPLDCPGVRVIAVNYTTDQYLWRPLWKKKEARTNLIQRSREMAELLIEHRVGYGHPIVWVGHSKGGLFVKQIIVDAWESGRPATAPFWRSARGCFFYSVPHRGSHLASIKAPLLTRSVELLDIEKNNKYLLDLHRRFAGLYHLGHLKIEVFSFVETALTLMSVFYMRIVGADSADPGIGDVCGIRLDHREICKPRSRDCILYTELVKMIKKVC